MNRLMKVLETSGSIHRAHIPLRKTLEAQLTARYDDYSDFGDTLIQFSLRWELIKQLMFRTSYTKSFRAPTLGEMYTNHDCNTAATYNDHFLSGGVPATGALPA